MAKAPRIRRYRVSWLTPACGFQRALTLRAKNKQEAQKLVAERYPARTKHTVECLR